jgi:hypothetical protein
MKGGSSIALALRSLARAQTWKGRKADVDRALRFCPSRLLISLVESNHAFKFAIPIQNANFTGTKARAGFGMLQSVQSSFAIAT